MFHYRLTLQGSPGRGAIKKAIVAQGGISLPSDVTGDLVWETTEPLETIESLVREHPAMTAGVERFRFGGDELQRFVIDRAETTLLATTPICPPGTLPPWRSGSMALPPQEIEFAVSMIDTSRSSAEDRFGGTWGTAMQLTAAIGRFCEVAGSSFHGCNPKCEDALERLGGAALAAATASRSRHRGEARFERALRLTEAASRLRHTHLRPDEWELTWREWVWRLVGLATRAIELAPVSDEIGDYEVHEPEPAVAQAGHELAATPQERFEAVALSLLVESIAARIAPRPRRYARYWLD